MVNRAHKRNLSSNFEPFEKGLAKPVTLLRSFTLTDRQSSRFTQFMLKFAVQVRRLAPRESVAFRFLPELFGKVTRLR